MSTATMPAVAPSATIDRAVSTRRIALIGLTVLVTLLRTGAYWDVQWHSTVGRDSFWIPPHLLLYSGVALSGLIGLYFTWRNGLQRAPGAVWPWGWSIVMVGAGAMVSAAPFDDWWHRLYGIDVTIWSPPHMIGVLGGCLIAAGLLLAWYAEGRAAQGAWRTRALWGSIWAATLLVSMINFGLVPAVRWSVTQPLVVTLYPALASLLTPLPLLLLAALTGRWWTPLAVTAALVALRLIDQPLFMLSTAYVAPLYRQFPRSSGRSVYELLTALVLLNAAPALVAAALLRWRRAIGSDWRVGALAGGAAGLAIVGTTLLLRTGAIIPTYPLRTGGKQAVDFAAETGWFTALLGNALPLALLWALLFGAISGLVALVVARGLGVAGKSGRVAA